MPASVSPVARILSWDGNRRTEELKGKSKALQTDVDMTMKKKKKNSCMLSFYILESERARTQGSLFNAKSRNQRVKNEPENRLWGCGVAGIFSSRRAICNSGCILDRSPDCKAVDMRAIDAEI